MSYSITNPAHASTTGALTTSTLELKKNGQSPLNYSFKVEWTHCQSFN